MDVEEVYSSKFLIDIQSLKDENNFNPVLFSKLLVAFYAISNYRDVYNTDKVYMYNTKKVQESINSFDKKKLTENASMLQLFFKLFFKVVDKKKPNETTTITHAIVDTFAQMIDLSALMSSLLKIKDIREFTPIEKANVDRLEKEMIRVIGTRNHIISELINTVNNQDIIFNKALDDGLDKSLLSNAYDYLKLLTQFDESN
jgi:hypothetical protein